MTLTGSIWFQGAGDRVLYDGSTLESTSRCKGCNQTIYKQFSPFAGWSQLLAVQFCDCKALADVDGDDVPDPPVSKFAVICDVINIPLLMVVVRAGRSICF